MKLHFHVGLTGGLDRFVKLDCSSVDGDPFVFESFVNIDRRHGTEGLAVLAYVEGELGLHAGDLAGGLLGFTEFLGFTLGTGNLKVLDLTKVSLGCLVGFA